MKTKKAGFAVAICLSILMGTGMTVWAVENGQEKVVEYSDFSEIQECISTDDDTEMYLVSVENMSGIWQTVYLDEAGLENYSDMNEPSPHIVVNIEKTVVNIYDSFGAIPETLRYEEYNDDYSTWMKGTLTLQSVEQYGARWKAVYKGLLQGHI